MKALMFALVLVLSVSVYAKTEATINVPGNRTLKMKQTWEREIANSDNALTDDIFDRVNQLNKPAETPTVNTTTEAPGFASSEGVFTKPKKQKAPASAAPLEISASAAGQ